MPINNKKKVNSDANKKLFGTSGIRGKVKDEITAELTLNVGKALATYLGGKGDVVIGYDSRTTNQMLENAICAGLLESGCNVLKLKMVPTPLVGYAVAKLGADAGIMITASHNPSEYNGIKVWNKNGMAFTPPQEEELEEIYYSKEFNNVPWKDVGNIHIVEDIKEDYITELLDIVDIQPGLKVVVDCASGAGSELSPIIFRRADCDVISLNSQVDGFFPGRNPEPTEKNLKDLMKVVVAVGADIGIAHDGDADRMIAVDDKGRICDFDKLLAIVSREFGGKIITTVDAGSCVDYAVKSVGGEVIRTKVGDVSVAEAILEENATFGGEPSGTWLHPDFCMCPDGILSGLRITEIVSKRGPLSNLLDDIPDYPTAREKIICSNDDKFKVMDNIESLLKESFKNISNINPIDGVRLTFDDSSWVLIRPSGTENFIRITIEAKTQKQVKIIKDTCVKIINDLLK